MLDSECDTGKKVICRDSYYHNQIGYISTVVRANGKVQYYLVKDKIGGAYIGGTWYALSCWDLCPYQDSAPHTLRSASLPTLKKSIICPCGINRKDCDYHKE